MDPTLTEAIRQHARQTAESRLRQGSSAEQIKSLNSQVMEFTQGLPTIGKAVGTIAEPLVSGYNFFVDNVLSPVFGLGPSQADIDKETARQERIAFNQVRLNERNARKEEERNIAQQDYEERAFMSGFGSTEDYRAYRQQTSGQRARERLREAGFESKEEYKEMARQRKAENLARSTIRRTAVPNPVRQVITIQ